MRKLTVTVLSTIFSVSTLAYGLNDTDDNDSSYGRYGSNEDSNYRYEGPSGTKYQYDLSNPGDQVKYSVDPGAQLMDRINPNPAVDLDRDLGAPGGGAEW